MAYVRMQFTPRVCARAQCGIIFTPSVGAVHQKYHDDVCRSLANQAANRTRELRRKGKPRKRLSRSRAARIARGLLPPDQPAMRHVECKSFSFDPSREPFGRDLNPGPYPGPNALDTWERLRAGMMPRD